MAATFVFQIAIASALAAQPGLSLRADACGLFPGEWLQDRAVNRVDMGGWSMVPPPGFSVRRTGVDSSAGHLLNREGLRIDFDFGLYADPLRPPPEATDAVRQVAVVDGRAAAIVRYRARRAKGAWRSFVGVHIPQVHPGRGEGLSLLGYVEDGPEAALLPQAVDEVVRSIRFSPPPP